MYIVRGNADACRANSAGLTSVTSKDTILEDEVHAIGVGPSFDHSGCRGYLEVFGGRAQRQAAFVRGHAKANLAIAYQLPYVVLDLRIP